MEIELRPTATDGERRALEAALRRWPPPVGPAVAYRSRWRTAGLPGRVALPPWAVGVERSSPGARRA